MASKLGFTKTGIDCIFLKWEQIINKFNFEALSLRLRKSLESWFEDIVTFFWIDWLLILLHLLLLEVNHSILNCNLIEKLVFCKQWLCGDFS